MRLSDLCNILHYLSIPDLMRVLATCKKFYGFRHSNEIWIKVLDYQPAPVLAESKCLTEEGIDSSKEATTIQNIFLRIPDFYTNLVIKEGSSAINVVKCIRELVMNYENKVIGLEGLESSSHDYDQTIQRTLDSSQYNFWSSGGSGIVADTEWLLYKMKNGPSLISSVMIRPVRFWGSCYAPSQVRFKVGFHKDQYHYTSPLFKVKNEESDQIFYCMPDLVVGTFIKVEFYGKPGMQRSDRRYYIALRNLSCQGYQLDPTTTPPEALPTLLNICTNCSILEDSFADEFENSERILISMVKGETSLSEFSDQIMKDLRLWAFERRTVLLQSSKVMDHLDTSRVFQAGIIPLTQKDMFCEGQSRLSLIELILDVLRRSEEQNKFLDKMNTEIFLKMVFKCAEDLSSSNDQIFVHSSSESLLPGSYSRPFFTGELTSLDYILEYAQKQRFKFFPYPGLIEEYFKYDNELPDPSISKTKCAMSDEESKDSSSINLNYIKHILLQAMGFIFEDFKFVLNSPDLSCSDLFYCLMNTAKLAFGEETSMDDSNSDITEMDTEERKMAYSSALPVNASIITIAIKSFFEKNPGVQKEDLVAKITEGFEYSLFSTKAGEFMEKLRAELI
ncbi:unnamed protein product [Moneuplotes crassus]|uniref:F-box domain-containing protein n=1 Tax=Euplotes crassus TaxID=5936 RepID=A0AAD1U2K1_EUPCR|nr:unnamed protein product [Moneuplotes crassus]